MEVRDLREHYLVNGAKSSFHYGFLKYSQLLLTLPGSELSLMRIIKPLLGSTPLIKTRTGELTAY